MVDDILEESDAYRRGLRYGDEIVSFGGRPVSSVNAFKNVLGIFPKGWRVPLVFEHRGERSEILVRLRGVHREAELAEMVESRTQGRARKRQAATRARRAEAATRTHAKRASGTPSSAPLPEIVKKHYIAKPGYVNYYFNQLNRDRVWKRSWHAAITLACRAPGPSSVEAAMDEEVRFELSDAHASIKLPSGELQIELSWRTCRASSIRPAAADCWWRCPCGAAF